MITIVHGVLDYPQYLQIVSHMWGLSAPILTKGETVLNRRKKAFAGIRFERDSPRGWRWIPVGQLSIFPIPL